MAITHAPTRGRGLIDSLRMYHRGVDGDTTLDPEVPEGKVDRMRRELQTIRNRRSNTERRRFPNGIEDYVLITGFVLGALYLALITSMSTGVFGDSVAMDEASSRTFLDIGAAIVIFVPLIMPAVIQLGIDPMQAAMIIMLTLAIGLITPPVGVVLFVVIRIGRLRMAPLLRALIPFLLAEIGVVALLTLVPELSTWLPSLLD